VNDHLNNQINFGQSLLESGIILLLRLMHFDFIYPQVCFDLLHL